MRTSKARIGKKAVQEPSVQTFYHLCRLSFLDKHDERIQKFIQQARPSPTKANQGVYVTVGVAPFLAVCGQRFHHQGIPVIPIVHIKPWPLKTRTIRCAKPMQQAKQEMRKALTLKLD